MKTTIRFVAGGFLALAWLTPLPSMAQPGPQDHWVLEPDLSWGEPGTGDGEFDLPYGIAVDGTNVYVSERSRNKVQVFALDGSFTHKFGSGGSGDGQFENPRGVAVDDAVVYVADTSNQRIQLFGKDGTHLASWGQEGAGDGDFLGPSGVAVDGESLYVSEIGNHRVQVFNKATGTFVTNWGSQGDVIGQFDEPYDLAVDREHVYVADARNYRIQVFTKQGRAVRSWAIPETEDFVAYSVAVDEHTVYAAGKFRPNGLSAWRIRLWIFDKYGDEMGRFAWSINDTEDWIGPYGLAVDRGLVYLAGGRLKRIDVARRIYRTLGLEPANVIPLPQVMQVDQRQGTPILDVDYVVSDSDDATVSVYAAAFTVGTNAAPHLEDLVPMRTLVEGTHTNLGPAVAAGTVHRLSWDMESDGIADRIDGYGNLKVSMLARDARDLVDLHLLAIPPIGTNAALTINRTPLFHHDLLPAWFWLVATNDPAIALATGRLYGVGGAYDGQLLAEGTNTSADGRAFLFDRLDVREATPAELSYAREATTEGTVTARDPRREPPPEGFKVNEFNFVTDPTNGWWVVPLAP